MGRGLLFTLIALCVIVSFVVWLVTSGRWIPNEPASSSYPIRGVDVSHHQHEIDWRSVKAAGFKFAYIKATEGANYRDDRFVQNWLESRDAGLARGAYHFFTMTSSGSEQAKNFIAAVPIEASALPPVIDAETFAPDGRPSPEEFQRELGDLRNALTEHYGKAPIVYTISHFQERYLKGFAIDRLWIREVVFTPNAPWMFWQYSSFGRVRGVSTRVDLNVFRGNKSEFERQ